MKSGMSIYGNSQRKVWRIEPTQICLREQLLQKAEICAGSGGQLEWKQCRPAILSNVMQAKRSFMKMTWIASWMLTSQTNKVLL
ncbi:hypothetical protein COOONC_28685 [Cooperia oncophora]